MVLDIELFYRAIAKIVGDRADSIALLDRKAGDGEIRAVKADEGYIGAMQRGDERELAMAATRGQHLPGQHRAHRMRNGVMHVQQVQIIKLCHFSHPRGQR